MLKKRKYHSIQVGIWKNTEHIQAVWFDEENQPDFLEIDPHSSPLQMVKEIIVRFTVKNPALKMNFRFITAIAPNRIWSKTLILPQPLTSAECEQQCHYVLEQELPVPLNELWFDFCSRPLKQGFRLDIFAIMQPIAMQQVEQFLPLKINVLDNLAHCLLRAFQYLQPSLDLAEALLLYQDSTYSLAIQNKPHQLQILQTQGNLTALFAQFCTRYETPKLVVCYRTTEEEALPNDWLEIHTDCPFIALGAARWQQDCDNDDKY